MDEIAALLETQIPALRRYARALLRNDGRLRFDRLLLLAHRRDGSSRTPTNRCATGFRLAHLILTSKKGKSAMRIWNTCNTKPNEAQFLSVG